jgi:hypothetical protein
MENHDFHARGDEDRQRFVVNFLLSLKLRRAFYVHRRRSVGLINVRRFLPGVRPVVTVIRLRADG